MQSLPVKWNSQHFFNLKLWGEIAQHTELEELLNETRYHLNGSATQVGSNTDSIPISLVLASSSAYRASTLRNMGYSFIQASPNIDETSAPGESPADLARRLAVSKAQAIKPELFPALVIGSDQTGQCDDTLLVKPGSEQNAVDMLCSMQGKQAMFFSAVATVFWKDSDRPSQPKHRLITTEVKFHSMSSAQLARYVGLDQSLDCAGGFKVEQLGIALFEYVRSDDPSALVGLPAIALTQMMRESLIDPIPH